MTIVTRFAPSPTGYLHIGGARTALFCWLLARKQQGRFILRIEDTDQKRNTPTATTQLIKDLKWLGLDWDEGPDIGGHNGPYKQSERLDIYSQYLQKLLDTGKAYYCFDTPKELQAQREKAQAEKKTFLYPRPETFPTEADVEQAKSQGRPVVVRFVMPDQTIVVEDLVRGEVTFSPKEFSDIIIRKSDGFPTFHFACVVDDELMEVTHVIRGQEHLMNTPGHQALQEALGFRTPVYAHISVTVSEGGGKLSKRERGKSLTKYIKEHSEINMEKLVQAGGLSAEELDGLMKGKSSPDAPQINAMAQSLGLHLPEINVVDFFEAGYLPEAMVNFTALLGWNPGDNREVMAVGELIEAFDLKRLNKTNSLFDRRKLISFNTEHYKMVDAVTRLSHFKNYLQADGSALVELDDDVLLHLLAVNEGAQTLAQVRDKSDFLVSETIEFDPKAVKKVLQKEGISELLSQARDGLASLEIWQTEPIHELIKELAEKNQVGMGKVAQPLRVAITGTQISPPIQDSLYLLGRDKVIDCINNALEYINQE
jgi:glutamyl/glutaminyl-tRNA synthetase